LKIAGLSLALLLKPYMRSRTRKPPPRLRSIPHLCPRPPTRILKGLIGEYGTAEDKAYVPEDDGSLYSRAHDAEERLAPESQDHFRLGAKETTFSFGKDGEATLLRIGDAFRVCAFSAVGGGIFRIVPLKPVAELTKLALVDHPPVEKGEFLPAADLVKRSCSILPSNSTSVMPPLTLSQNAPCTPWLAPSWNAPIGSRPREPSSEAHGIWASDSRRLPALVRHQSLLGRHSRSHENVSPTPPKDRATIADAWWTSRSTTSRPGERSR